MTLKCDFDKAVADTTDGSGRPFMFSSINVFETCYVGVAFQASDHFQSKLACTLSTAKCPCLSQKTLFTTEILHLYAEEESPTINITLLLYKTVFVNTSSTSIDVRKRVC